MQGSQKGVLISRALHELVDHFCSGKVYGKLHEDNYRWPGMKKCFLAALNLGAANETKLYFPL